MNSTGFPNKVRTRTAERKRPAQVFFAILVLSLASFPALFPQAARAIQDNNLPDNVDFNYPDFSDVSHLVLKGDALQTSNGTAAVLRLTSASTQQHGSAWYDVKQDVAEGFITLFQFKISPARGADGFAFVVQNNSTIALGGAGGYLGYDGIPNSIAVEFDTYQNVACLFGCTDLKDISNNEISIHTKGTSPNSASEQFALSPGPVVSPVHLADDYIHKVKIVYSLGVLGVFVDDMTEPVLAIPVDLSKTLSLSNGTAYVGFTGATGDTTDNHDILKWSFVAEAHPPNLVRNGDFSDGLFGWRPVKTGNVSGVRGEYPIFDVLTGIPQGAVDCTPSDKEGNPFLNIETPFGAKGYVEQNVTIPSSGGHLSFVTWGNENSDPQYGISGLVSASTALVDGLGIEHTLGTFTPPPMLNPGNPADPLDDTCTGNLPAVMGPYDLSAYAGQVVKLRLGATSQNCCGTNAFFDDVLVDAQGITFQCPPHMGFQALPGHCALPNARAGNNYSYNLSIVGGVPPYTSGIISGCCPPGITTGGSPPGISGKPTLPGVFPILLRIEDSAQLKNRIFVPITLTVTPIITNLGPFSGVKPVAGPAQGGTPVNITGIGFTGASDVRFNDTGSSCGFFCTNFHFSVDSDWMIRVEKTPGKPVGLVNVTVLVNGYSSGFWCSAQDPQSISAGSPSCNQFRYLPEKLGCTSTRLAPLRKLTAGVAFKARDWIDNVETDVDLGGALTVTPQAGFCVQMDGWNLKSFNFTAVVDVSASLNASVYFSAKHDNWANPYRLHDPFQSTPISAGPIVIVPTLTPVLIVDAAATGNITVTINHNSETKFGITYTPSGGLNATAGLAKCNIAVPETLCTQPTSIVALQGRLKLALGFEFSLLFYDLAGPLVTPDVYLRFDAGGPTATANGPSCDGGKEGNQTGMWWALCGGLEVGVGVQVNPWLDVLHILPGGATNWNPIAPFEVKSALLAAKVSVSPGGTIAPSPGETITLTTTVAGSRLSSTVSSFSSWNPNVSEDPSCRGTLAQPPFTPPGVFQYTASSSESCTITFSKHFFGLSIDIPSIGNSHDSVHVNANPPVLPPTAPQNPSATGGVNSVEVRWQAPSSDGGSPITGYKLYRSTSSGGGSSYQSLEVVLYFNDTSVICGTTYFYRISALNSAGEGLPSSEVSASPICSVPSAPQYPSATGQLGNVHVQWQPPSSDGGSPVKWYVLYRGTSSSDLHVYHNAITAISFADTSVICQVTYHYIVSAVNSVGEGPTSPIVSASPFCAPTISVSPTRIDVGQSSALSTTTSFSGGTSGYVCQWLKKGPSDSGYRNLGSSFSCTAGSTPSTSTGVLPNTGIWSFELQVTDISSPQQVLTSNPVTVTVNQALAAPLISASSTTINSGQSSTLSTTTPFGGGTSPYTCQWLQKAPGAASYSNFNPSFSCNVGDLPTTSTGTLSTIGTWSFELQITDGEGMPETVTSSAVTITVNAILKIVVFTNTNSPIQGAVVTIVSAPLGQTLPPATTTGPDGMVTFSALVAGQYMYKVTANGYQDWQGSATVPAEQLQSVQLNLVPSFPWLLLGVVIGIVAAVGVVGTYVYRRNTSQKRVKR